MQEKSYVLVDTFDKLKDMVNHVKDKEIIAFDTETNSLNTRQGTIIGFSVSAEVGKGYYMPTAVFDKENNALVDAIIDGKNCQAIHGWRAQAAVWAETVFLERAGSRNAREHFETGAVLERRCTDHALQSRHARAPVKGSGGDSSLSGNP